jgi:hypothetical protein
MAIDVVCRPIDCTSFGGNENTKIQKISKTILSCYQNENENENEIREKERVKIER